MMLSITAVEYCLLNRRCGVYPLFMFYTNYSSWNLLDIIATEAF